MGCQGQVIENGTYLNLSHILTKLLSLNLETRSTKSEMVRQAVRQAHGHEQGRMAHHPQRACREPLGLERLDLSSSTSLWAERPQSRRTIRMTKIKNMSKSYRYCIIHRNVLVI
jgi:hypothetical protein